MIDIMKNKGFLLLPAFVLFFSSGVMAVDLRVGADIKININEKVFGFVEDVENEVGKDVKKVVNIVGQVSEKVLDCAGDVEKEVGKDVKKVVKTSGKVSKSVGKHLQKGSKSLRKISRNHIKLF
jgi:hypothetical protein